MPSGVYKHKPLSEEHKRKIGLGNKGKVFSKSRRNNISKALKGRKFTPEWIENLSQSLKGRKVWNKGKKEIRPEVIERLSISHTGKNGSIASNWKGGKVYSGHGYILIYKPTHPYAGIRKYVREHRLVIEKQIGRYLLPSEKTHHLNGVKNDNRLENLMAFTSNSAHIRFHHNPDNVKPSEIIFDGRLLI